jgi:hypothetical protein
MPVKRTEQMTTKAPVARKPATRRKRTPTITHEDIAVRAYYLHTEGGHDPHENWIRAERELTGA